MRDDVWIYHERQEAALCGQHALNNLVQDSRFSADSLAEIARHLDDVELKFMSDNNEGGIYSKEYLQRLAEGSGNVDEQGNFSIQVLRSALEQSYGFHLPSVLEEGILNNNRNVTDIDGFICNKSSHWFAIRKINGRYWNLNSTDEQPTLISHFQLATEIEALQNEGYSVFCVTDKLPPSSSEGKRFSRSDFWWKESDLLNGTSSATSDDAWTNVGSGMRLDGKPTNGVASNNHFNLTEEEAIKMALEASLQTQETNSQMGVPDEPAEGTPGAVKVQIRLPNGKRVVRRFLQTDPVSAIYDYVKQESEEHFSKSVELKCGFPPKDMSDRKTATIEQANLSGEMIQARMV